MRLDELQILTEAYRGRLYHWTVPDSLADMTRDDSLEGRESVDRGRVYRRKGTSFARTPHATFMNFRSVVLVFDGEALSQRYRMEPRFGDSRASAETAAASDGEFLPVLARREAEEFIEDDIRPLSRFLTHVVLSRHLWSDMMWHRLEKLRRDDYKRRTGGTMAAHNQEFYQWNRIWDYLAQHHIPLLPVSRLRGSEWVHRLEGGGIDLAKMTQQDINDTLDRERNLPRASGYME